MSLSAKEALGDGFTLEFGGKTYSFAPADNVEVVGQYETYLEEQAWRALQRAKQFLPAQEYADQMDGIRRDVVSGVYSYGSRYWLESLKSMGHQKQLVYLMGLARDREFSRATVDQMYEDVDTLRALVRKAFGGDIDPNDQRPTHPATA